MSACSELDRESSVAVGWAINSHTLSAAKPKLRRYPGMVASKLAPTSGGIENCQQLGFSITTLFTTLLLILAPPSQAAERNFLIVASGIGGEPVYSEKFAEWSKTMISAAVDRLGIPRQRIVYLAETGTDGADAESRKS